MKKRTISAFLVILMVACMFSVQALAYTSPPTMAGLRAEGVRWTTKANMGLDWEPEYFDDGTYDGANTAQVAKNSTYIQLLWWDHGEPNGNVGSNQGWTWGGNTTYKINGVNATPVNNSLGTAFSVNGTGLQYNTARAYVRYISFPASQFTKTTDKVEIEVYRLNQSTNQYVTRKTSFTINWRDPVSSIVSYNSLTHSINRLDSSMEFTYQGAPSGNWYTYSSGSNNSFNMYPYLSTTRSTEIQVRYKATSSAPASESWFYTIPALSAAPTGLYVDWYSGTPALWGLDPSRYYAMSTTPSFDTYVSVDPGYTGVLLSALSLNTGDTVYVRSAASAASNSPTSAYAAVTVPSPAPATVYDSASHSLYGLQSTMDFRLFTPPSWSGWIQVPADDSYFNAYPYLSSNYDSELQVRYRSLPNDVQTIVIPALAPAPAGLELEWVDGVGLVLWELQAGYHYNLWFDPYFDNWYPIDSNGYGLNITSLGLQPGDPVYIRVAADSTSATSACVELIVPNAPSSASSDQSGIATHSQPVELDVITSDIVAIEAPQSDSAAPGTAEVNVAESVSVPIVSED